MIGARIHGVWTVVAAAPEFPDTYVFLAVHDNTNDAEHLPYVVSTVGTWQLPNPETWSQGHYFTDLARAVEYFIGRLPHGEGPAYVYSGAQRELAKQRKKNEEGS